MRDGIETSAACASCGHRVAGDEFCSRCGEEVLNPGKRTLRYFLTHTVVNEILNVDGKIWRTLKSLLFRPGFLALEYAAGRRRPYVGPMRVVLVALVVYVLATGGGTGFTFDVGFIKLSMAPSPPPAGATIGGTLERLDRFGILEGLYSRRFGPTAGASEEMNERFNRSLDGFATPLSFMTVLLVALTLYACFHRRRPLLVEHAVFAMHHFSFVLLSFLLVVLAMKLRVLPGPAILPLLLSVNLWQLVYPAIGIKRFYFADGSRRALAWAASTGVAVLLFLLNSLYITAIQFAAGAYAIARL